MLTIDISHSFTDNALVIKRKMRILLHWTGGTTAEGAINWLDKRLGGNGTVGYCNIIDEDVNYVLYDPRIMFMQSSGLGKRYDAETIPIAFVSKGAYPSKTTIDSLKEVIADYKDRFGIFEITHHRHVNKNKPDFPDDFWDRLKKDLGE